MNENEKINGYDLKPCPFCGGEATIHVNSLIFNSDVIGASVVCTNCNARGPIAKASLEGIGGICDLDIYENHFIHEDQCQMPLIYWLSQEAADAWNNCDFNRRENKKANNEGKKL